MISEKTHTRIKDIFLKADKKEYKELLPLLDIYLATVSTSEKISLIGTLQLEKPDLLVLSEKNIDIPIEIKYKLFHQNFIQGNTENITQAINDNFVDIHNIKNLFLDKNAYTNIISITTEDEYSKTPTKSQEFRNAKKLIHILDNADKAELITKNEKKRNSK